MQSTRVRLGLCVLVAGLTLVLAKLPFDLRAEDPPATPVATTSPDTAPATAESCPANCPNAKACARDGRCKSKSTSTSLTSAPAASDRARNAQTAASPILDAPLPPDLDTTRPVVAAKTRVTVTRSRPAEPANEKGDCTCEDGPTCDEARPVAACRAGTVTTCTEFSSTGCLAGTEACEAVLGGDVLWLGLVWLTSPLAAAADAAPCARGVVSTCGERAECCTASDCCTAAECRLAAECCTTAECCTASECCLTATTTVAPADRDTNCGCGDATSAGCTCSEERHCGCQGGCTAEAAVEATSASQAACRCRQLARLAAGATRSSAATAHCAERCREAGCRAPSCRCTRGSDALASRHFLFLADPLTCPWGCATLHFDVAESGAWLAHPPLDLSLGGCWFAGLGDPRHPTTTWSLPIEPFWSTEHIGGTRRFRNASTSQSAPIDAVEGCLTPTAPQPSANETVEAILEVIEHLGSTAAHGTLLDWAADGGPAGRTAALPPPAREALAEYLRRLELDQALEGWHADRASAPPPEELPPLGRRHSLTAAIEELRAAADELERTASRLERMEHYEQADLVRGLAAEMRHEARGLVMSIDPPSPCEADPVRPAAHESRRPLRERFETEDRELPSSGPQY